MSAQVNYYMGLSRGNLDQDGKVVVGTVTNGTSSDVELRMQINNGSTATGITKKDVQLALEAFERYLTSNGVNGAGAGVDLPAL